MNITVQKSESTLVKSFLFAEFNFLIPNFFVFGTVRIMIRFERISSSISVTKIENQLYPYKLLEKYGGTDR